MSLSNYPPGLSDNTPGAPWSEPDIPEKDFEVTCCQTLSKTVWVTTNNYIPGASGVDYEPDGEGGYYAYGYQEDDDTSDTCWSKEYKSNGYKTPQELIGLLKEYLERDLRNIQRDMLPHDRSYKATQARRLKGLIEECEGWDDVETEICEG